MASDFEMVVTQRLVLRAVQDVDTDDLFTITSDPRTWEHAPAGRHASSQTTREWIKRANQLWDEDGLSYWLVRLRLTDEVIGVGGAQRQKSGNWNLYYRFAPMSWGHGFATELGKAALNAAHSHDGGESAVIAWVLPHNVASIRVAERLGLMNQGLHVDPSDGLTRLAYADRVMDFS